MQEEKKHAKLAKKQAKKDAKKASEPAVPDYFKERAVLWSTLKKKYNEQLAANATQTIKIGLADGTVVDGTAGKTTPLEVAQGIGSGLASDSIVAKVNDVLWDMERPLEADCEIDLLKFEEPEAKQTFWYSTACLLGEALERVYGVESNGLLCGVGVIDKGFYADIHLKEGAVDLAVVQQRLEKIFLNKAPFEQIEASKEDALQLFAYNLFQKRLIEASTTERIGIYRSGQAIGVKSHTNVRHPKKIKVYKLMKVMIVMTIVN